VSVTVNIHRTHRQFTGGADTVQVEGTSVGRCLEDLIRQFPGMEGALFNGKGRLKNAVEIYLNQESAYPDELKKPVESAYPDELKKPVNDGDEIHITLMLAGG